MNTRSTKRGTRPASLTLMHSFAAVLMVMVLPTSAAAAQQLPQVPAFLPMSTAVPKTQAMPIDGTWTINTIGKRIRIEAGRAYAVDPWTHLFVLNIQPGMVVLKNIQPTAPGKYAGQDLPLMGGFNATVAADGSLDVSVSSIMPAHYRLTPVILDNRAWFDQEMKNAGLTPPSGGRQPAYQPPAYQPSAPTQTQPRWSTEMGTTTGGAARTAGDAAIGPPVITCGHIGEPACEGDPGRVAAVYTRKATWWGCPNEKASEGGRKIYFTPHNGGECWACPDGFRRTLKPIHEPNTCNKEGWSRDTATATLYSSAWGCGANEFRKGSKCYACPNNTEKVAFLGVFNPEKTRACKGLPWICSEGVVAPMPAIALQKVGPPVQGYCMEEGFDLVETAKRLALQHAHVNAQLRQAVADFLLAAKDNDDLKYALRHRDAAGAVNIVYGMPQFQNLLSQASARGYQSFSLGTVADLQLGYGANQEIGFLKDFSGTTKVYATTGVSKGPAIGVDFGLSLGLWKKPVNQLSGYGHGVAVSADVGVSIGTAAWFDFYPVEPSGISFMVGIGVGVEAGEYNQVVTSLYDPDTPVAIR